MKDFVYYSPTKFVFGRGLTDSVGDQLVQAGATRVMIVYGKGSVVRNGTLDRVKASLEKSGLAYCEKSGVRPNPEVNQVREGIVQAREFGADFFLAIGGGSTIDCAKAISFGVPYEGDVWDFFCGKATITSALPVGAVLTLPAAGSEGSNSCVISNDELNVKNGTNCDLFRPVFAVMDPELTMSLPAYQTSSGITDMIAHVCERYFSGVGPVPVTDNIATGLIRAIMQAARVVVENPNDYDARANIMWAGTLAHNDIAGCGRSFIPTARAGGWESHALEHALSAVDPSVAHGAGLAVVLPAWMRYVYTEDPQRFLDFARDVFGIEPQDASTEAQTRAIEQGIDALQDFYTSLGMPTTLRDFGFTEGDIEKITASVIDSKGAEFGSFKKLNADDVTAIFRLAL